MNKLILGMHKGTEPGVPDVPFAALFLTDADGKEEVYFTALSSVNTSGNFPEIRVVKSYIRNYIKTGDSEYLTSFQMLGEDEALNLMSSCCGDLVYYALESYEST